jgi:taurine dioxygenase
MRYRPLSETIGIELLDFDVARPCSREEQAELRALFCERHLLLIRGQQPTEADQDRFTQYFGPLSLMLDGRTAGYISNRDPSRQADLLVVTGQKELLWHADGTQGEHPGIGTSLLAIEAVPESTPTLFANAVRAARELSPPLRARVEGRKAAHYRETYVEQTDKRMREEDLEADAPPDRYRACDHPILYQLPHSDKQALFVNELSTSHVIGMAREAGEQLLQELFARIYAEDNIYTHRWQTDDLLIWDNIALQHCRPSDIGSAPRHLRRLSLDGWNTGDGVMDWFAAGTLRDVEQAQAQV